MKTVNQPEAKRELISRLEKIKSNTPALWGRMNAHQAVCHLTDQLRDLEGERPVKYNGNPILKFIIRPILSRIENWPRAIFPAAPDYDQLKNGTKPGDFEKDKQNLLRMFSGLDMREGKKVLPMHPAFGKLSNDQYARIVYKHFDHHLKQFGI